MSGEAELVPSVVGSALALSTIELGEAAEHSLHDPQRDSLLYVSRGSGSLALGGEMHPLPAGSAALVLAGEEAAIRTSASEELTLLRATVGPDADRHAPLGPRETVVRLPNEPPGQATGARSFQVLFGPHNGSTRATLFAGFVPPGAAPWHYHLYDEILWIPEGPGRLLLDGSETPLGAGAAFRLRPRQPHVVENTRTDRELALIGVFTPAGSPSAAYLV